MRAQCRAPGGRGRVGRAEGRAVSPASGSQPQSVALTHEVGHRVTAPIQSALLALQPSAPEVHPRVQLAQPPDLRRAIGDRACPREPAEAVPAHGAPWPPAPPPGGWPTGLTTGTGRATCSAPPTRPGAHPHQMRRVGWCAKPPARRRRRALCSLPGAQRWAPGSVSGMPGQPCLCRQTPGVAAPPAVPGPPSSARATQ